MPPVTVIGAGPTGLTAALVLRRYGVPVRIVDAAPERSRLSLALVVQPRTLELLARMGLARELEEVGHAAPATNIHVDGERILRARLDASLPRDTAHRMVLFVSQVEVEQLLVRALNEAGGRVERPVELAGLSQEGDHVQLRWAGAPPTRASWVIGADGAHSAVRHALGLSFDGAAYASEFLLGDVVVDADEDTDELQAFLGRAGITALFPLPGRRTRVITTDPSPPPRDTPLQVDELQAKANTHARRAWRLSDPVWLARFRLHHRGVTRFRVGRAFVAGDAAHIHSPLGGQGMNTGIQDAANLAWKLAMVVRGQAPPDLLDTYDAERLPVCRKLLRFTDQGFSVATEDNQWLTALRNGLLPWLAPAVATDARRARVARFVSQLGIRYARSPLNGPVEGPGPSAGDRYESPELTGMQWWLCATGTSPRWRRRVEAWAGLWPGLGVAWGPHAGLVSGRPGVALVRPDGHLALRTNGPRLDPVDAYLSERGLSL